MTDDLIKPRASNAGDDFHIQWTARRLTRLLATDVDPGCRLVAVKIEGASRAEGLSVRSGELGIDTAEYYGSENIREASRIGYYQHKHSTTRADIPLAASDLDEPLSYFAQRYSELVAELGREVVNNRLSFVLVTNRPISKNVVTALAAARAGDCGSLKGYARNAYNRLKKETRLIDDDFCAFVRLVDMPGGEPDHNSQAVLLGQELSAFIPGFDPDVALRLTELVRKEALPEARNHPAINRDKLLAVLNVTERDLLPAPADFPDCGPIIQRTHDQTVADVVVKAKWPVVVTASGGTGKTVLAQILGSLMPSGSKTVVFDGFCNGSYRRLRQPRHLPRVALTQICNELAIQGLCDPLLPLRAEDHEYYEAFRTRLIQAAATVRARNPDALVVIVLDAADNSAMAAEEAHDTAFVWGLLQESPPDGCRIVAFARPHRVEKLKAHSQEPVIELKGFTPAETTAHLRRRLPDADDTVAETFHRLTLGNPRVQFYFLARNPEDGQTLIAMLGPAGRTVDDLIAEEVERALTAVRETTEISDIVDQLCFLLGQLPPFVPVPVLARAAGVPESAIQSFVADLPQPLLIREDGVQFRDEPVEHWFRQQFPGKTEDYARAADRLEAQAGYDAYVAMALPRLLYEAGRQDGLQTLALSDDGPAETDPLTRRDIVRMRIAYALRAALRDGRQADAAKLFIRVAEEAATQTRQAQFIRENADLFAVTMRPDDVADLLFRQHRDLWKGWGLADRAEVFALSKTLLPEALPHIRQAAIWIDDSVRAKKRYEIKELIVALVALTHAGLIAAGAKAAYRHSLNWRPWVRVRLGRCLADRLIDHGQLDLLSELCAVDEPDVFFHLGVLVAMDEVSMGLSDDVALKLGNLLLESSPSDELGMSYPDDDISTIRHGAVILAEWLAVVGKRELAGTLLAHHRPELRDHLPTPVGDIPDDRVTLLRAASLDAVLHGRDCGIDDLKPESLKEKKATRLKGETLQEFERFYGAVLPMFFTRAKGLLGSLATRSVADTLSEHAKKIAQNDYRYSSWRFDDVLKIIPRLTLDTALRLGFADSELVGSLNDWVARRQIIAKFPLLIQLSRTATRHAATGEASHRFADQADLLIASARLGATETARSYASLARSVLTSHIDLTRGCLDEAVRILDRLDFEARERLETILALANKPGVEDAVAGSAEAYRVSRVAEAVEVVADHKFPWERIAGALARLCPPSALAVVSRWRDRGRGLLDETLPCVTLDLVRRGLMAPGPAAALETLGVHWKGGESLEALFSHTASLSLKDVIFSTRCRDVLVESGGRHDLEEIVAVGRRNGLDTRGLDDRLAKMNPAEDRSYASELSSKPVREDRSLPDWESILGGQSWASSEELDAILEVAENADDQRLREVPCLHEIRRRTPRALQSGYVRAVVGSRRLSAERVIWELKSFAEEWPGTDIRTAVKVAAEQVLERRALELMGSDFGLAFRIQDLESLLQWPRERIVRRFAEAAATHLDGISSSNLLTLGEELSKPVSPTEALDILRFALDRFELILDAEDGDGPWDQALAPESDIEKAVAGLVWATLGAPEITMRWRAAHAVRRLCMFGATGALGHLVDWMDHCDAGPFVDRRLTFYHLHARLFLLMALSRAALDHPAMIAPHVTAIARHAVGAGCLPHAVIRLYARDACLAVEAALPGTIDAEALLDLQRVGVSRHPPAPRPPYPYSSDNWLSPGIPAMEDDCRFDYDLSRYGFSAIGQVFGLTARDVGPRVAAWCKRFSVDGASLDWRNDQRLKRGVLRGEDTHTSRGGYSKADNLNFYLTIHGMMCASGELFETTSLVVEDGVAGEWNRWIEDHRLSRSDGRWIADRRDPSPPRLSLHRPPKETEKLWLDGVASDDFANMLFDAEHQDCLVVSGRWSERHSFGDETVSISSALANPRTSGALMRALQSAADPDTFAFPPERSYPERVLPTRFRLSHLTAGRYVPSGIDQHDPLSGRIQYPPAAPRPALMRLLGLTAHDDERLWHSASLGIVFRSQLWGYWDERDPYSERHRGRRLLASFGGLDALLRRTSRNLVIWVRVERAKDGHIYDDSEEERRRTTSRAFVLQPGGNLLDGTGQNHRLG
ncbi:P-loop NTPase family protein [Shumkonia mesophila]|uniref:hypothetical protein n=1 Tax=Shumkonia mesophila TaxID=2838854 RepID=UPI00293456B4|nr:hypothetical protein [Shumkonia mesophila]